MRNVRIRKPRFLAAALLAALAVSQLSIAVRADEYADSIEAMQQEEAKTQQTISDLEKQTRETKDAINALQGQKEQTESNVSNLQSQSRELKAEISGYTNQLDDLSEKISETQEALAEVSSEIVDLSGDLMAAQAEEAARYADLKKRLQSIYESGGTGGMARLLLESGSMSEFLTRSEYLNAVVEYDFRKIAEYQALQERISAQKTIVEDKESELDSYQSELDERHEELTDLTDTVRGQLSNTNSSLSSERSKLESYDQQLKELDAKMKSLEAQTAEAQAKLARQIAERLAREREDTSGSYAASADEWTWLAATIQAEADGESYTGKLAVGSVIMNRVKSSAFPNTVVGVITQNMQFASYRSGKVELIISRGPNSTCMQAAREVLDGARVGDYLFFMTKYYADYYGIAEYTMIGNHAFFYRWVTVKKEQTETSEPESNSGDDDDDSEDDHDSEETDHSDDDGDEDDDHDDHDDEDSDDGGDDDESSDE